MSLDFPSFHGNPSMLFFEFGQEGLVLCEWHFLVIDWILIIVFLLILFKFIQILPWLSHHEIICRGVNFRDAIINLRHFISLLSLLLFHFIYHFVYLILLYMLQHELSMATMIQVLFGAIAFCVDFLLQFDFINHLSYQFLVAFLSFPIKVDC